VFFRNCFSVTKFKECEELRGNSTDNIIFLNRCSVGVFLYLLLCDILLCLVVFSYNICKTLLLIQVYDCFRTCITEESMLAPFKEDIKKWYGSTKQVIQIQI